MPGSQAPRRPKICDKKTAKKNRRATSRRGEWGRRRNWCQTLRSRQPALSTRTDGQNNAEAPSLADRGDFTKSGAPKTWRRILPLPLPLPTSPAAQGSSGVVYLEIISFLSFFCSTFFFVSFFLVRILCFLGGGRGGRPSCVHRGRSLDTCTVSDDEGDGMCGADPVWPLNLENACGGRRGEFSVVRRAGFRLGALKLAQGSGLD